jgi:NADH-quinone oxidoreductase subunit C
MNDIASTTPLERLNQLQENLRKRFESQGCEILRGFSELTMVVPRERLIPIATELRDEEPFLFEEIIDVCGVDYATYGKAEWATDSASETGFGRGVEKLQFEEEAGSDRFAAVYHLLSVTNNQRLRLRVFVDNERPIVDSVVDVWSGANWFEREAFDLFGIMFTGHPDLRRILTDYGFIGHPFRKDFPISGHVEMRYDPEQQRVIYQPITIPPRPQVPKVVRDDNRYQSEEQQQQDAADV